MPDNAYAALLVATDIIQQIAEFVAFFGELIISSVSWSRALTS